MLGSQIGLMGSPDRWVGFAARRVLQDMFLHSSPAWVREDAVESYLHSLRAHYDRLIRASGECEEGGRPTVGVAVCALLADMLKDWRRRREERTLNDDHKLDASHEDPPNDRNRMQILLEALDASSSSSLIAHEVAFAPSALLQR